MSTLFALITLTPRQANLDAKIPSILTIHGGTKPLKIWFKETVDIISSNPQIGKNTNLIHDGIIPKSYI